MHQLITNNRWIIAAIAVVALLGALTFGAAIAGASGSEDYEVGGNESGQPVTVIERTVIAKEVDPGEDDRGARKVTGQGVVQGGAQGDDQADDRGDDRGEYRDDDRGDDRGDDDYDDDRDDADQGGHWDDDGQDDAGDDLDD